MVTPFAAAYLIVDDTNVSDADFNGEIRFGSAFQIVNRTHAFAALHTGNGTMFFLGFTAGL